MSILKGYSKGEKRIFNWVKIKVGIKVNRGIFRSSSVIPKVCPKIPLLTQSFKPIYPV